MKNIKKSKTIIFSSIIIVFIVAIFCIYQYQKPKNLIRTIDVYNYDGTGVSQAEVSVTLRNKLFADKEVNGSITVGERIYTFDNMHDMSLNGEEDRYTVLANALCKDEKGDYTYDFVAFDVSKDFDILYCYDDENGNFIGPAKSLEEAEMLYESFYTTK